MKAHIFINQDKIGVADLQVIDETMGVLSGQITAFPNYNNYRPVVQKKTDDNGGANIDDFPFLIKTEDGTVITAQGGVMLIDSREFGELSIEVAGVNVQNFMFDSQQNGV